eukprot:s963_g22.t1
MELLKNDKKDIYCTNRVILPDERKEPEEEPSQERLGQRRRLPSTGGRGSRDEVGRSPSRSCSLYSYYSYGSYSFSSGWSTPSPRSRMQNSRSPSPGPAWQSHPGHREVAPGPPPPGPPPGSWSQPQPAEAPLPAGSEALALLPVPCAGPAPQPQYSLHPGPSQPQSAAAWDYRGHPSHYPPPPGHTRPPPHFYGGAFPPARVHYQSPGYPGGPPPPGHRVTMANVRASSRSSTGSQRLFGKASLVGNTVRAKIGGRVTALAIPTSEAAKLERAGQDATAHRKLQAAPEYALELEHVYGYTENCQNVISTGRGYCYTASSLGVLWDEESQNQRFLQGHTAEVTAIAYSSSTQLIATGQKFVGNKSSGIRVWSVDQPGPVKEKCQILGHNQSVYSLAFSADGRWLFSMAAEERARSKGSKQSSGRSNELTATTSPLCAWKLDDAKLKAGLQPRASHLRLAMKEKVKLESNRLLAFGGRAAYFITCDWAAKDVSQRATWNSPSPPDAMAGLAFYGFSAGCFIPGEDNLAVLAVPGGVFVIDALESGPVCRYGLPLENLEVRFLLPLPSGHLLCGGSGGCLSLLESDLSSAEVVKIAGVSSTDFAAATVTTGTAQATETMVVAGAMNGSLLKLRLDIETRQCSGELLQQSPSGMAEVRALAVNPSAPKNLAVADSSGVVFFYDLEKRKMPGIGWQWGIEMDKYKFWQFHPLLFLPPTALFNIDYFRATPVGSSLKPLAYLLPQDGTSVASNARDGAVLCWEVETGKVVVSNFPAETWFGDGHRFGLTISWAMWGAWSRDSYRSSAAVLGESHGTLRVLATGDVDGLVRLQRFPVPVPDALSKELGSLT